LGGSVFSNIGVLSLEKDPEESVRLVVCGDFNGGPEGGAIRYLEDGFVDENFREDGEPVSSNRKELPLTTPLKDVATAVASQRDPPPTLVVSELISNLTAGGSDGNPVLCQAMLDRLERLYRRLATGENEEMSLQDVEKWLVTINRQLGRGDEYREAARQMGWQDSDPAEASAEEQKARIKLPDSGDLSLDGFVEVYSKELRAGKFWGIAHDMACLCDPLPSDAGVYTARFDRIYYSSAIQPTAVMDTVSSTPCPNDSEPSDHLPVAASFQAD
jgi:hypothetical protein